MDGYKSITPVSTTTIYNKYIINSFSKSTKLVFFLLLLAINASVWGSFNLRCCLTGKFAHIWQIKIHNDERSRCLVAFGDQTNGFHRANQKKKLMSTVFRNRLIDSKFCILVAKEREYKKKTV